jgi:hypothetical protein
VLDNKIYIIGGRTATDAAMVTNTTDLVQIFDPELNQWTVGKPLPTGVYAAGACATSGLFAPERICVVGGNRKYVPWVTSAVLTPHGTTLNQIYDPATGNWSYGASLPEPRWKCSLVNINDTLFVVGGENGPDTSDYFDNPEKVVLEIDRYIPSGYEGSLLPTPSPSPTAEPLSASLGIIIAVSVTIATLALVVIILAKLLVYYKKRRREVDGGGGVI